jgi:replicative DNA helicase
MKAKKNNLEESVISSILNNPELMLGTKLDKKWFGRNRRIIQVMQELAGKGVTVDALSVADALGGSDEVLLRIVELKQNVFGSKHNIVNYIDQLRLIFEAEAVQEAITKASQDLSMGEPANAVLSTLLSVSMSLITEGEKTFNYNTRDSMRNYVEKLEQTHDARDSGGLGLKTGIEELDKAMGGMHPSDLVVIGARPGAGKTSAAVSIMRSIAKTGKKVGFFSTEMSNYQVMSRFVSMEANIDAHKLREANLDDADFARLTAATSVIDKLSIQIYDKPAITIGELSMQARAWAADGLVDFIAVDYLTRIKPDKEFGNKNLEIGDIITEFKNLARTLNIPVMVLAQLNRQGSARKDKRPIMSDLRDSGIIEQEADQILMLYREDDSAEIIIEKNRHGATGIVRCVFDPAIMKWSSFAD